MSDEIIIPGEGVVNTDSVFARFQLRQGDVDEWTNAEYSAPLQGEPIIGWKNGKPILKIGNGNDKWNELPNIGGLTNENIEIGKTIQKQDYTTNVNNRGKTFTDTLNGEEVAIYSITSDDKYPVYGEVFNDYYNNINLGKGGIVTGVYNRVLANYSSAEGNNVEVRAELSHGEGHSTVVDAFDNIPEYKKVSFPAGYNEDGTVKWEEKMIYKYGGGESTHVQGRNTTALGNGAHCEGDSSKQATSIDGYTNESNKTNPEADTIIYNLWLNTPASSTDNNGRNFSIARGVGAHTEGQDCVSIGSGAHAGGYRSAAFGDQSFAHGVLSTAKADFATAFNHSTVLGEYGFGGGYNTFVNYSSGTAFGDQTSANSYATFVAGRKNLARTEASSVFGWGNQSTNRFQTVVGKLNAESNDALFVVGNGKSGLNKTDKGADINWDCVSQTVDGTGKLEDNGCDRSNAFMVFEDGHAEVGAASTNDLAVATYGQVKSIFNIKTKATTGVNENDSSFIYTANWTEMYNNDEVFQVTALFTITNSLGEEAGPISLYTFTCPELQQYPTLTKAILTYNGYERDSISCNCNYINFPTDEGNIPTITFYSEAGELLVDSGTSVKVTLQLSL